MEAGQTPLRNILNVDDLLSDNPEGPWRSSNTMPIDHIVNMIVNEHSYSPLEILLLSADPKLLWYLCSFADPQSLVRLGQTNTKLRIAMKYYSVNAWSLESFLAGYINPLYIGNLQTLMRQSSALIFGPAVLLFFDRASPAYPDRLDIAVPSGHATVTFGDFFFDHGYKTAQGYGSFRRQVARDSRLPEEFATGDRFASEEHYESQQYVLQRPYRIKPGLIGFRAVILHSVHCDPHLYVLSQHSSEYAQFFEVQNMAFIMTVSVLSKLL